MAIVDNILGFSLKKTINNIIIDNLSEDIPRVMTATLFLQQNCSNTSFKQELMLELNYGSYRTQAVFYD